MNSRAAAVGATLLLSLAAPAAAEAVPTIQPLKPCYVTADTPTGPQSEGIQIAATGFAANSTVALTVGEHMLADDLQADAAGTVRTPPNSVEAPFVESGSRDFTVTLTEQGNPANTVSATAKSTALGVSVDPDVARPSDRIRFKGLGFTRHRPVYAHYVRKGKLRRTVRMARKTRDCGAWKSRKPQFPMPRPHTGKWIIQFDQRERYFADPDKIGGAFVRLRIDVSMH